MVTLPVTPTPNN